MTNLCAHYRVRTYEMLSQLFDVEFIFCDDRPRYWLQKNGTFRGRFRSRHLRRFRFPGASFNPGLPWVLWRCRCDVYVKCINGRFALPLTYLLARLRGRPFVLWTGVWHRLGSRAHRLGFPLTRYLLRRADAVVAYGSHVRDYLISEGVRKERLFVAPHAVDNARYRRLVTAEERRRTLRRMGVAPGERVILYVGRLESCKGVHYLVDAAAKVRSRRWRVVLAGEGAGEDAVVARARARGLGGRVRALGHIASDETIRLYAVAAMVVLPSITTAMFKEPWGLVVNEAFNQAVPVIATGAVGAVAGGLVQHEVTGLVVGERDSDALAQAMQRLLDDDDLRRRLGKRARLAVCDWSNCAMVEGFGRAIRSVLHR